MCGNWWGRSCELLSEPCLSACISNWFAHKLFTWTSAAKICQPPGAPEQISTLSEHYFCYFWPKKAVYALFLRPCFCVVFRHRSLTRFSVNAEEKRVQSQIQVTYLSIQQPRCKSAGGSIHSLHHAAVNSFSYPVKGRVNPPSIWHAAHLVERHSGWLEGGEPRGCCGRGSGGVEEEGDSLGGVDLSRWTSQLRSKWSLHTAETAGSHRTGTQHPGGHSPSWPAGGAMGPSDTRRKMIHFSLLLCFVLTQKPRANQGI